MIHETILKMMSIAALGAYTSPLLCGDFSVASPDGSVQLKVLLLHPARLGYEVTFKGKPVIDKSPLGITVNNLDLGQKVRIGNAERYETNETYAWRGVHAQAVNSCNGAKVSVSHEQSKMTYVLEVRAFNDGVAFRYVVPGEGSRVVSSEATSFVIPEACTIWYHDFYMHYEGIHQKRNVSDALAGEWAAPPLTFKLPHHSGYAAITEAAIINYSGMGLQADGQRGFQARLGHEVPASYPYTLRYGEEDAMRLSAPAAIEGVIRTPWRVVMIGADLNTLVRSDIVHNLAPPPDQNLFPEGFAAPWLKPGRAVWGYLNNGGRTLEAMEEFSRLAGELGFEYHVVEGHWQRWPESEQQELVDYSQALNVKVIFWKHSRELRDPQQRREFFEHLHKLGVAGAKIDFFDHEAKEIMDLYQACLKEAAQYRLVVDFHGANKPAGEARTWPNELTREGIRGYEFRGPWAAHNATLPFTRMLAGHADYTPMHFGDRRTDTSEAHQIASAIIFTSPLLIFAEHPQNILNHKAVALIKQIPAVWDETVALPVSEIGELAAFVRKSGEKWFIAVMNGPTAKGMTFDLSFLGTGEYQAMLVRDEKGEAATVSLVRKRQTFGPKAGVIVDITTVQSNDSFFVELIAGGGFVALLSN
ncbi:MAG: glycoside hydrolase family 97 N-terminal domain-containing protein [bacterium]